MMDPNSTSQLLTSVTAVMFSSLTVLKNPDYQKILIIENCLSVHHTNV